MAKTFTALFLLIILGGSLMVAGIPLHSGEQACSMQGMDGMDCCAKAQQQLLQNENPEVAAARLCCAVECQEPGTTGKAAAFQFTPRAAALITRALARPRIDLPNFTHRFNLQRVDPSDSPPVYIRHLALLI